jgi:hypothetical protein
MLRDFFISPLRRLRHQGLEPWQEPIPMVSIGLFGLFVFFDNPIQDVAPRAVSTAEIIDARICSVHLRVSFFVIRYLLPD